MIKKHLFFLLLWGGFSLPVGAQDLPISQIIIDGEGWELLSEGHQFTEGPAVNNQGEVFFTDVPTSEIFKITLGSRALPASP